MSNQAATWRRINRYELSESPDLEIVVKPDWEMPAFAVHEPLDGSGIVPNLSVVLHQVELPRRRLATAVRKLKGWLASRYALDLE